MILAILHFLYGLILEARELVEDLLIDLIQE